jgi:hypothetical protein
MLGLARLAAIRSARRVPPRRRTEGAEPAVSGWGTVLRHPLTAILVSSLVGSFLVPSLVQQVDAQKRLRDKKHAVASKIVEMSLKDSSNLGTIDTILRHAYLSNPPKPGSPKETSARAVALLRAGAAFETSYLEFNKAAWYWPWQVFEEAKMEGIVRDARAIQDFDRAVRSYTATIGVASRAEKDLKMKLIGLAAVPELGRENNEQLERLQAELFRYAREMAQIVLAPSPCRLRVGATCILERS